MGDPQYGHLTDRELLLVIATKQDGHTERLNKINGQVADHAARIGKLEGRHDREDAVAQDRKRWLGVIAPAGQKAGAAILGAGGGYVMALIHAYVVRGHP